MIYSLREFLDNIIYESLHPELQSIVTQKTNPYGTSKQAQLAKKIKELTSRGENTGIEGNMPKGSSRAYLPIKEPVKIILDGIPTQIKTGMKVAIRATLDKHHDRKKHDGMSLGQLQNEAEGGDHFLNSNYRIITKDHETGHYHSNSEFGIFPPLIDHDDVDHKWTHVVHVDKINGSMFRKLTRTESHPKGISHDEFCSALERVWNKDHGKYWKQSLEREKSLDHIESHPLVQKFLDHQRNMGMPPHDYRQMGNMGIWKDPHRGEQHIVARDHGFSANVMEAYSEARSKKYGYATT
jgi:hypothetical protein